MTDHPPLLSLHSLLRAPVSGLERLALFLKLEVGPKLKERDWPYRKRIAMAIMAKEQELYHENQKRN